ncbi:serine/threonine protein phosphatase [Streptomyces armeniacus]|uniref:Serine/threonine protein phosphatase n=1 Tax=Streptomyces armeniacus TaxID=83291 RepID=A0A345XR08_9ACTN|nr:metallophosphoesterase family protein [Streptomyces armeniacus]AXK34074.1 serine/threonine protein phosphatase [Streptomyces armeniacus]
MPRTVIVGDIHGCFDELRALLDKIGLRPDDRLVSVGDLVDRGPAPGEVVRLFRERPNSFAVMGNHERKHVRGIFSYAQEITRLQLGDRYAETVDWMRTLPYYFENEHVRVVHAAVRSGTPLHEQREEILCGTTRGERDLAALFPESHWHDHYTDAKPVVFGHHVTGRTPLVRDGRIYGLDTGACHGWNLTALCVPGFTLHSVEARADHWAYVRRRWQLPVLKSRPWRDASWAEIDKAVARYASPPGSSSSSSSSSDAPPDAALRDWLLALERWAAELRAAFPVLADAARRAVGEPTEAELRAHPAAKVLFQARNGRLDQDGLARQCPTPARTLGLAAALGLALPEPPG